MAQFQLKPALVAGWRGGTLNYLGQTYNVGTALTAGGGTITTSDPGLEAQLEAYYALQRVGAPTLPDEIEHFAPVLALIDDPPVVGETLVRRPDGYWEPGPVGGGASVGALAAVQSPDGHYRQVTVANDGRVSTTDIGLTAPPNGPPPYATVADFTAAAKVGSPNTFTQPNTFRAQPGQNAVTIQSAEAGVTASGYTYAAGTSTFHVEPDGSVIAGPSPLATDYDKTHMPDAQLFEPYSVKSFFRSLILRELGDTVDIQGGRRPGVYPYTPGDTLLTSGVSLPAATLLVASTAGFAATGVLIVESALTGSVVDLVTYTGKTPTTFTGCTGGTHAWSAGGATLVSQAQVDNDSLLIMYGSPWSGRGGFQARTSTIIFKVAETHRGNADGSSGYHAAGRILFSTTSNGPNSQRLDRVVFNERGQVGILGAFLFDHSTMASKLTVGGPKCRVSNGGATLDLAAAAFVPVDAAQEFPTSGTLSVDTTIGTYTGLDLTVWPNRFTGWTRTSGPTTQPDGANMWLTPNANAVVVGAFKGRVAAQHAMSDGAETVIGNVGPAFEGGITVPGSGAPTLYKAAGSVWGSNSEIRGIRGSGSDAIFAARITGDTGYRFQVGAGGALSWSGTGDGTERARIESQNDGTLLVTTPLLRFTTAAAFQTTVGAAGGGSAPPATPVKYMKIKDSAGTTLVIPCYTA